MVRLIVFSFASLMDVILSAALFVCMVRLADMHASAKAVAAMMLIWAGVYMVASYLAGYVVTRRNAAWLLIGACVTTFGLAGAFLVLPGARTMYVLMAVQGLATAFFFTPFQVFMKFVDQGQNRSVSHSTGLYTFSWSSGYALGPFIAGYLWEWVGWRGCHVFNAVVAATIAVGVYCLKHHADTASSLQDRDDRAPSFADESGRTSGAASMPTARLAADLLLPDLAWMSWLFGGLGCLVMAVIRSIFPSSAADYGISKPDQGSILFVLAAVQAVVGLGLGWAGRWMYRPLPVLGFGLFGVAGLFLFGIARAPGVFFAAACLFGIYSGSFYFYFVFHSLVHPSKSGRYVSVNEAIVGLVGIVGPLAAGFLADRHELSTPYLASVAILAAAIPLQAAIHYRHARQAAPIAAGPYLAR